MLRPGHFRHRLLDEAFLNQHSAQAYKSLQPFISLWKKNEISAAEMAAIYILIFSFLRRPQDFLGGPHQQNLKVNSKQSDLTSKKVLEILRSTFNDSENLDTLEQTYSAKYINSKALQRFNNDQNFIDFFCFHSWRSIPFSAIRSINEWHHQQYPLIMMKTVPSPDEVLTMQAQGSRCVSMLTSLHEICNFVGEGRDVFGFILHDLIHADHFFRDSENAKAQIEFSKRILTVRNHPAILDMMKKDPIFVGEFHYLMSDMNSVPLHLLKAFKTVLLGFYKRRDHLAMTSTLRQSSELEFCNTWKQLLAPWCFSEQTLQAALRLNTPEYMAPDDSILLDQALRSFR